MKTAEDIFDLIGAVAGIMVCAVICWEVFL